MFRHFVTLITLLLGIVLPGAAQAPRAAAPTINDLISLKRAASPAISPDASVVAYTVRETNWDENVYDTEIWVADARSGAVRQVTNGRKSSTAPAWAPDGKRLAFASDRDDKRQIYLIDLRGGEAVKLTSSEESVGSFAWSRDGRSIAYIAGDPRSEALKEREKQYGELDVIDEDHRMSHLYVIDVDAKKSRQLTKGAFTVGRSDWSPDGKHIAFDHRIKGCGVVGVETKLIVYRGFEGIGHGPTRPKSSRALMQHNLDWFDRHLFGGASTSPAGAR